MIRHLKSRWILGGAAFLAFTSAACVQLAPMVAPGVSGVGTSGAPQADASVQSAPTADVSAVVNPTVTPSGRQTVTVRRGPIAELLAIGGRVAALEEAPVPFPSTGRVDLVAVKPGQAVEAGQLL